MSDFLDLWLFKNDFEMSKIETNIGIKILQLSWLLNQIRDRTILINWDSNGLELVRVSSVV